MKKFSQIQILFDWTLKLLLPVIIFSWCCKLTLAKIVRCLHSAGIFFSLFIFESVQTRCEIINIKILLLSNTCFNWSNGRGNVCSEDRFVLEQWNHSFRFDITFFLFSLRKMKRYYDEIKSNQKIINYCLTISGKSWTKFSDNIRRITTLDWRLIKHKDYNFKIINQFAIFVWSRNIK